MQTKYNKFMSYEFFLIKNYNEIIIKMAFSK